MQEKFFQEGRKNCQTNGGKRTRGILVIFSQIFLFVFKAPQPGAAFSKSSGLEMFIQFPGRTRHYLRYIQNLPTDAAGIHKREGGKKNGGRKSRVGIDPASSRCANPLQPFHVVTIWCSGEFRASPRISIDAKRHMHTPRKAM